MEHLKFKSRLEDPHSSFYAIVKLSVEAFMNDLNISSKPTAEFWVKALFWFVMTYGCFALILTGSYTGLSYFFFAFIAAFSGLMLGFNVGHDACHRAITGKAKLDEILHVISFATVGVDALLWRLRHIKSHHRYANVNGSDQDIDKNPLLRLSPEHPWKPKVKYQAYYAPFAYCLALLHSTFIGDWVYLLSKDYQWMREGTKKLKLWILFVLSKTLHFSFHLILPIVFTDIPIWMIVTAYFLTGSLNSLIFITFLVGTHFFDEADFPVADEEGQLPFGWAEHQLRTSCDWNPESFWASFFSGGANNHACHHLFPNYSHIHYRKLTPLIKKIIAEHGLTYHSLTLPYMVKSHFKFLKRMGQDDSIKKYHKKTALKN